MGEFGIRLEAGEDAACDDPRVLSWLAVHEVTPSNTYAIDVFQETFTAHCFHTNDDGSKHLHGSCDHTGEVPKQDDDDVCRCKPREITMILPFPSGVMAGPGHMVDEGAEMQEQADNVREMEESQN